MSRMLLRQWGHRDANGDGIWVSDNGSNVHIRVEEGDMASIDLERKGVEGLVAFLIAWLYEEND